MILISSPYPRLTQAYICDSEVDRDYTIVRDWAKYFRQRPPKRVAKMYNLAILTIRTRKTVLVELFVKEWTIIGRMKRRLNKLIENCRICEKKIRVYDLITHSFHCERRLELREKSKPLISQFMEYCDIVMLLIVGWIDTHKVRSR